MIKKILKTGQWFLLTTKPFSGQALAYGFQPAIKMMCMTLFACSLGSIVVCYLLEVSLCPCQITTSVDSPYL